MDLSGLNSNVLLEIGIAHGFGKIVVLLKEEKTEMPANLLGIEYIEYSTIDSLKKKLEEYIRPIIS
jgi:predicted nucleotide-binding protein